MKYIILTLVVFMLSNCELKTKELNAQGQARDYEYKDFYYANMHYRAITFYELEGGMYVINLTKDSLEVKLLKNQLNNFK
jgi:hypothetical protein